MVRAVRYRDRLHRGGVGVSWPGRRAGTHGRTSSRATAKRSRDTKIWIASSLSLLAMTARGPQFFVLSTSAPFLIHGIMSRSLAPTSSIGWVASLARVALNEVWLTLFSSIQSRAKRPDWMSASTRFISALVSALTMRGPETYSPYSAVLEIE